MKILLTNDDGIDSPGLKALADRLSEQYEIIVVAPSIERSGSSNSLTFKKSVIIKKIDRMRYSCSGTPADCVHRTLHKIIDGFYPDLVISGINNGPNLGTDIIYSGTAAGARQAAIMGVPGVAVSVSAYTEPFYFNQAADFIAENVESFVKSWNKNHFLNINVPSSDSGSFETMITRPSKRFYSEKIVKKNSENSNRMEISLDILGVSHEGESGTDCYAIENGIISLSPVYIQPVADMESEDSYRKEFYGITYGK